ncbi:hypothetical protein WDU94_007307, partial [Cyamophila willieti]
LASVWLCVVWGYYGRVFVVHTGLVPHTAILRLSRAEHFQRGYSWTPGRIRVKDRNNKSWLYGHRFHGSFSSKSYNYVFFFN